MINDFVASESNKQLSENSSFPLEHSCIYVKWNHPNDTRDLWHYLVSWTLVGKNGERIEEQEQFSNAIPYDPSEFFIERDIDDIIQGECYDVKVVSVGIQGVQIHSPFNRVQTCKSLIRAKSEAE